MNIRDIHDCYGCGVCAAVCGRNIIKIVLNNNGFYEPRIEKLEDCTNCGLCKDVCAWSQETISIDRHPFKSYAAWSKDANIRRNCSSGGVGFELGRTLIGNGYKVCAVRYNAELNHAEHYIATTEKELIPSIGSKYIQSFTIEGFNNINRKEKHLIIGTPCQIDSYRRYLQKLSSEDNFILVDFFCHGVPSKLLWDKYVKWAERKVGKLTFVSWRNKFITMQNSQSTVTGEEDGVHINWHDSYNLLIRGEKTFFNSRMSKGDIFYKMFLSDSCLGKACYEKCKYKYDKSSADIRIGDLWGNTYQNNELGVSAVITFSPEGDDLLHRCNCELIEHPFEIVAEGQMKENPKKNHVHNIVMRLLKTDMGISTIYSIIYRYRCLGKIISKCMALKSFLSLPKSNVNNL